MSSPFDSFSDPPNRTAINKKIFESEKQGSQKNDNAEILSKRTNLTEEIFNIKKEKVGKPFQNDSILLHPEDGTNHNIKMPGSSPQIESQGKISAFDRLTRFDQIENLKIPSLDVELMGSKFSLKILIKRYLLDFFVVIPYFVGLNLFNMGTILVDNIKKRNYKDAMIYFFIYGVDSLFPMSYIFLFIAMCVVSNSLLYIWCGSCFILFCVFLLLVVYFSIVYEDITGGNSSSDLLDFSHLDILGVGLAMKVYKEKFSKNKVRRTDSRNSVIESGKLKNYDEFKNEITQILEKLTIDDSFFFYSYIDDNPRREAMSFQPKSNTSLCFVNHRGDQLLYKISEEAFKRANQVKGVTFGDFLIGFLAIFLKIVIPYIYLFSQFSDDQRESFPLFTITLFYLHLMLIVIPLISHEDLGRRTYILECLNKIIFMENSKNEKEPNDNQMKENNKDSFRNSDMDSSVTISSQIDITCLITLETWDNCRRTAILLDQERSKKFEFIYIFLGMYAFFITMVLLQVLFKIYIFFNKEDSLGNPLIILIFSIDFSILLSLFFHRIYYGSSFNDTFKKNIETMDVLSGIYDDLIDLFEFYYYKENLKNSVYKKIMNRIRDKISAVEHLIDEREREKKKKEMFYEHLLSLRNSINRINKQVQFDLEHYNHRFLEMFSSDFQTNFAQACVLIVPTIPSLIHRILGTQGADNDDD